MNFVSPLSFQQLDTVAKHLKFFNFFLKRLEGDNQSGSVIYTSVDQIRMWLLAFRNCVMGDYR